MAKLNVVIPAADVEVIGEGGVKTKYRKVERKAQVGDIIKITDNGERDYVINGAFYEVTRVDTSGDPHFRDEDGDDFDGCKVEYEVYEKVTETAQQYREVKRPAKVGERIKIVNAQMTGGEYKTGAEMVVTEARWSAVHSVNADYNGTEQHLFYDEYVVLEPIAEPAQPKRLTVGDYAKVIADSADEYKIGAVIRIVRDDRDSTPYKGEYADGTSPAAYLFESDVEPATEAEFLAQNRLKVGEYVKVTDASGAGAAKDGDIGVITNDNWGGGSIDRHTVIDVKTLDGREYGMFAYRFVRATEAEVEAAREAAKQALKYGDFTDGDYAQIVNATDDNSSTTVKENGGKFGKVTREVGGYRSLMITFDDGDFGYCNPDALRKVTREEYEAAVDPRNQFAKGDKVRLISGGGKRFARDYEDGGIYTVVNPRYDSVDIQITGGGQAYAYVGPEQLEKVSAEEIAEIERLKVGEYARTLVGKDVPKGSIVKITHDDLSGLPFRGELLDGSDFDWYTPDQLEKVSAKEVAETERMQAEAAKWAAIGRKVNEYKAGDIVQYTSEDYKAVVPVLEACGDGVKVQTVDYGICTEYFDTVKLIVPVEQRFDREEKSAA